MKKFQSVTLSGDKISFNRAMVPILTNASFILQSGSILMISGQNGSGKTSLLRIIAGLTNSYTGQLRHKFGPESWIKSSPLGYIGWLGHKNGLKSGLCAKDNLALWCKGRNQEQEISKTLQKVGLENIDQRPVYAMSAGQQRRLAIARLLIGQHPIWIMDEPVANLDKAGHTLLEELLQEHTANNGSAIIASHDTLNPKATISYIRLSASEVR